MDRIKAIADGMKSICGQVSAIALALK